MLKTEQILNAKFTPVSKGTYSAEEVDSFLKVVAQSYETLTGEKNELIKKISILADKIESYRNDEEAIKRSLLDAHKMADTINKNATIKSDTLIGDAETRAQLIVDGANRQSAKTIDEAREQAKEIVDNARNAVASLTERAQKETENAIANAKAKAAEIIANAEEEGKKIIGTSKQSYEFYSAELAKIQSASADFKAAMAALCNDQLGLLANVPEFSASAVDAAEEIEVEPVEEEPAAVEEEIIPELEQEFAALEDIIAEEPVETVVEAEEEQVVYVPDESADEDVQAEEEEAAEDIEEEIAEEVSFDEEEDEDLFAFIDEVNLDDMDIPLSLDDLIPSVPVVAEEPAVVEEPVVEEIDNSDEEITFESDIEDDDDDMFEGFKIDLDSIGDEDNDKEDDDDITSLFDSMFDD